MPNAGLFARARKSGGMRGFVVSPHGWPAGAVQNFGPSSFAGAPPRLFHTGEASRKFPPQAYARRHWSALNATIHAAGVADRDGLRAGIGHEGAQHLGPVLHRDDEPLRRLESLGQRQPGPERQVRPHRLGLPVRVAVEDGGERRFAVHERLRHARAGGHAQRLVHPAIVPLVAHALVDRGEVRAARAGVRRRRRCRGTRCSRARPCR